jgi:hypothetical protein
MLQIFSVIESPGGENQIRAFGVEQGWRLSEARLLIGFASRPYVINTQ